MLGERRDPTTRRTVEDDGRAKAAERRKMRIEIKIETVEHQPFSDRLRVHGLITKADFDVGQHHTHLLQPPSELTLIVEGGLNEDDKSLLDEALADTGSTQALIVVVEHDEVSIYALARGGVRDVDQRTMRGGGKRERGSESVQKGFLQAAAASIVETIPDERPLVLCGPGQTRDQLATLIRDVGGKNPIESIGTSTGGRSALNEILVRNDLNTVIQDHAIVLQSQFLNEALERIAKDGAVAWGISDLQRASEKGAIECLLVDADLLREEGHVLSLICTKVRQSGGEILQMAGDHDAGAQVLGFGGAIGLLRWRLEDE